jgi:MFS family permease
MDPSLPEKRLRWYNHLAVNSYTLGLSIASGIITPLLLPYLVVLFMPAEYKNTYLGNLRLVGLAVAMLVQPMAGMLSDRSTSRFGRRRPFIVTSAVLNSAALAVMALSMQYRDSFLNDAFFNTFGMTVPFAILLGGLILSQISSNLGQGASQGLLPDVVPPDQRGRSSGFKAVMELAPALLIALLAVGRLVDQGQIGAVVAIVAGTFLLTALVTALFVRERPQQEKPAGGVREPFLRFFALTALFVGTTLGATALLNVAAGLVRASTLSLGGQIAMMGLAGLAAMAGAILIGVYLSARIGIGAQASTHTSFIWWVINRLLFLAAVGSIQAFAQYFLADVLHIPNAAQMTTILLAVVALFLLPSALIGGSIADRVGHRKLIFYAGLVGALGTVVLIFSRGVPMVIVSGCIIGLATGVFMATNWALGTQLVPPQDAGRFLGISNLAGAGAGMVGAGIGGPLADFFNRIEPGLGYLVLFAVYAGLFLISALTLVKIRPNPAGQPAVTTL